MTTLHELLTHLLDTFADAPSESRQGEVLVTGLHLDLPFESRLGSDGDLRVSLPRGVMTTGFQSPLGRLQIHCAEFES